MKKSIILLIVGILVGFSLGYVTSDHTAYSATKDLQRQAFTGGLVVFCTTVQDATKSRVFTDAECSSFADQSLAGNDFETWYNLPSSTTTK